MTKGTSGSLSLNFKNKSEKLCQSESVTKGSSGDGSASKNRKILSQASSSAGLSPPSTLYKQWKAEEQGKRKSKFCASVFNAPFVDNLSNLITSGSTAYSYGRTVRKENQFGTIGETSSWTAPAADALVDSQLLGHV